MRAGPVVAIVTMCSLAACGSASGSPAPSIPATTATPTAPAPTGSAPIEIAPSSPPPTDAAPTTPPAEPSWALVDTIDGVFTPGFDAAYVAVNLAQWDAIRLSMAWYRDRPPPAIDFERDIVVVWTYGLSSSCDDESFDDVVIDAEARTVAPVRSSPYEPETTCTADYNPRARVVTIERAALPPAPFDVVTTPGCDGCDTATVDDVSPSASATIPLSPDDLAQILAAAARLRAGSLDELPDEAYAAAPVEIIDTVGRVTDDGYIDYDGGVPLDEATRALLTGVAARDVRFVPPTVVNETRGDSGYLVVGLAAPAILDGHLTITSSVWCGMLCAQTGANELIVDAQRIWTIGGPIGPQTVS